MLMSPAEEVKIYREQHGPNIKLFVRLALGARRAERKVIRTIYIQYAICIIKDRW